MSVARWPESSEECSRGLVSIITLRNRRILELATHHGRDLDELFEVPRFSWPNSSISKSYDRGVFSAFLPLEKNLEGASPHLAALIQAQDEAPGTARSRLSVTFRPIWMKFHS